MTSLQRVVESLLLATAASRAVLHQVRPDGGFEIQAEAVQHGQRQIRHHPELAALAAPSADLLKDDKDLVVENDIAEAPASGPGPEADSSRIRARMRVPLVRQGQLAGVISLHQAGEARRWGAADRRALLDARAKTLEALAREDSPEPVARVDLHSAATQAILDRLRAALDVQRCTFRQPVQEAYAFPVTFESRAEGMRSLLGDFTIVQTGQPVIVKLLAERKQVIQEDCQGASTDPLFHKMLAHYGGMRAQMVTPFIVDDRLKGVLSVHELRDVRAWTVAEKALAAEAAVLIGTIFEAPLRHP
jgi:GAF domain-containing protein